MRPFGWGIAGFGWVARDFVAPAIAASGGRVAAVVDPSDAAAERARSLGARTHRTLDELASDDDVDAIYVATPNDRHLVAVEAAARRGKPILCEKPMAASLDDACRIADAVRESGAFYRTAFDQRHHPAHRALRDAVRAGRLGTVTAIRIVYACWLGADWTVDNWRIDRRRAGGGALIDLAPHGLDLAAFLVDDEVASVHATIQRRVHPYPVDDGALVSAATGAGVLVSLHVAYNHPEELPRRRLEIVGTGGLAVATDTMGQDPGGSVSVVPAIAGAVAERLRFDVDASPFREQIAEFVETLRSGDRSAATIERDLALFRLLHDASERAGCP